MVQFCEQLPHWCTETSINYLWLWMTRMEMDYNLKTFTNSFKFFQCILEKSKKNECSVYLTEEIISFSLMVI